MYNIYNIYILLYLYLGKVLLVARCSLLFACCLLLFTRCLTRNCKGFFLSRSKQKAKSRLLL